MDVKIDFFAAELAKQLQDYSDAVATEVKNAVDQVAKEVVEEIKSHVSFNQPTGDYVKSMSLKTTVDGRFSKVKTWYVRAPHFRLTHLLEKGHALRGGGRTRAYPHIKYGEDLAQKRMDEVAQEAIARANSK
jgi:predicted TIM-barrel enzyme